MILYKTVKAITRISMLICCLFSYFTYFQFIKYLPFVIIFSSVSVTSVFIEDRLRKKLRVYI